jgi:(1->4)-alpha-D-glucan 1-alpha-D-glucosylmutase
MMAPAIPLATYRLQLTPQFGFDDAAAIVPYLSALGIDHVYASPFLKARAGTTHGYDIIDHSQFNPEFGGEVGFRRMSDTLLHADMGLILDFVPNHMAVHGADNAWWLDVLEWGPRSPYANFFDIEWDTSTGLAKVLLPILGRSYGEALEAGEIELRYDAAEGSFSAWYYEHRLPIAPNRYSEILQKVVGTAGASDQPAGRRLMALASLYRGVRNPPRNKTPEFKRQIAEVAEGAGIIERGLVAYRPKSDHSGAILALHHLLERQHYRAAYWRLAQSDINYRRFFDINTLAGIKVEEPNAFKAIHPLILELIGAGRLQGLRLDHIDGLYDPQQYLRRLQREIQSRYRNGAFYIVIEKILGEAEPLPRLPAIAGTTGYEWLNTITRVLLDGRGMEMLDRTWRETSGVERSFGAILRQSKRYVLGAMLSSEFNVLAKLFARIAIGHYSTRDYTADRLRRALELFVLNFPIYRTYITATGPSPADRATIAAATDKSRSEWNGPDGGIFDFLQDALTLDLVKPGRAHHSITRVRRFAYKVQQFTGPMMAKSLEDTAFYRYHRLLALNEVGGNPAASALPIEDYHKQMTARARAVPHGLTATATHDTKRGEDARMRLLALAELADEWDAHVTLWHQHNASWIRQLPQPRPTAAHQYMIYQALLGALPASGVDAQFTRRSVEFAIKAAREGKEQTSWYAPNESYEANLKTLIETLLDPTHSADFLTEFISFAQRCALLGALNSLSQLTLKMTMPGVPDLYQGGELWDLSYVDPDNRRPVDYAVRQLALDAASVAPDWDALGRDWQNGWIKLALTHTLLRLRNQHRDIFRRGGYRPIEVSGPDGSEIIAYARVHGRNAVIAAVARHFARVTNGGRDWPAATAWDAQLRLEGFHSLQNIVTGDEIARAGGSLPVSRLLRTLPIAILHARAS